MTVTGVAGVGPCEDRSQWAKGRHVAQMVDGQWTCANCGRSGDEIMNNYRLMEASA